MLKKSTVSIIVLSVLANLAWSLSAKANFDGKLTVEINGLKSKEGKVCVSVFASSQGFPSDRQRVLAKECSQIGESPVIFTFDKLKAGTYAVAAFHDRNNDGILNRNNLNMPTEPFGFSRNPEVRTSAPKFSEAAFLLAGPNTTIQIQMRSL